MLYLATLLLLIPLPAFASFIVDSSTTEQLISHTIVQEDCAWIDTLQITTTSTYRDVQPVTITTGFSDPTTGTGYVGGQPGRAVKCPEDCDPGIVLGSPALTNVGALGGAIREWEEKTVSFITQSVDNCIGDGCKEIEIPCEETPNDIPSQPVPEPSTFVLFALGIILCVVFRKTH